MSAYLRENADLLPVLARIKEQLGPPLLAPHPLDFDLAFDPEWSCAHWPTPAVSRAGDPANTVEIASSTTASSPASTVWGLRAMASAVTPRPPLDTAIRG